MFDDRMEGMDIRDVARCLSEGFVRKERIEGKVNCEVALHELVMLKAKLDLCFLDASTSSEVRAKPCVSEVILSTFVAVSPFMGGGGTRISVLSSAPGVS
jgi:hypothetical protein